MESLRLYSLTDQIRCFYPTKEPLSADVVLVEGKEAVWVFDVGAHPDIPDYINRQSKPIHLILSHFHPDHIGNLNKIHFSNLYLGKNTYGYVNQGNVVDSDLFLSDDKLRLHIFPIPSSHAKGSLALEINETFCFIGDAAYATKKKGKTVYNAGLLQQQIKLLSGLPAKYILLSHHEPFLQPKQEVLDNLWEIYAARVPDKPYIEIDE